MTRLFLTAAILASLPGPRWTQDEAPDRSASADRVLRDRLNQEMMRLEQEGGLTAFSTLAWSPVASLPELPRVRETPCDGPTRYQRAAEATVMFHSAHKCDRCANWHGGVATGFVIHPDGWIVTAAHVVKRARDEGDACAVMLRDGSIHPVKTIAAIDDVRDVAIVRIDAKDLPVMPLATTNPAPGSDIWVVSHPQGRFFLLTEGVVSRLLGTDEDATSRLEVTAGFATGSSGAPVIDACGNVVGMALSTVTLFADEEDHRHPQLVIKQCVSVEDIRAVCNGE